ncbi:MAG: MBL fold metallo-hydrolase [Bacteroidia bacterium]
MQITFTGTGTSQGIPVIACSCNVCQSKDFRDKRLRSSIHIQAEKASIVIDTGPDFRQQMLRENIKHLDAVVFTHEHKDHTAGLDDVRAFNFVQKKAMKVYATKQVQEALKREFAYAFADTKYPGVPEIALEEINAENPFTINDVTLIPILVYHYKLPVLGFRIGDFTYITDANFIPEKEKEKIKGSKIIVINALRRQSHISHFTLDEAISLMEELKPKKAYFTHISHQLGKHEDVSKELPDYIQLAYDGLKLNL